MGEYGFMPVRYDPFGRQFEVMPSDQWNNGNTIYVRDLDTVRARVATAPEFRLGTGVRI